MEEYPRLLRALPSPLGNYVRPGRNDHTVLLQLISEDRFSGSGLIFDPRLTERHRELRSEAQRRGLECILDPLSMELSMPGAFSPKIAALPWGGRLHEAQQLTGKAGESIAASLAGYVKEHSFTSVLAPAHYLTSAHDPWLEVDRFLAKILRDKLDESGQRRVPVYFPLIASGAALRDPHQRDLMLAALRTLPVDAIWLRVHPFGESGSGPLALRGYIESCRALHELNIPLVAEKVGSAGLALLAFGAVGGVETGVTIGGDFNVSRFVKARERGKPFLPSSRVYISSLGAFLPMKQAAPFFENRQMKALFGCRNEKCCPRGARDMLSDPRRHFLITRAGEVGRLSRLPHPLRPGFYLDEFLRPATDLAIRAVRVMPELERIRKRLESWRLVLGSMARAQAAKTYSQAPEGHRIEHRRGA